MARHMRTITIDQLESAIDKILKDYDKDLRMTEENVMRRVVQKGAAAVRGSAQTAVNGRYARGWGSKTVTTRFGVEGVIYHKQTPGLPHLLEFGHAMPQGGRSKAKPHVETVEQEIYRDFIDTTKRGIEGL